MSKALKRLMLAALAASLCATAAAQVAPAQSPDDKADTWLIVAPEGERFGVLMSGPPTPSEQRVQTEGLSASGRRYSSAADGARFTVWSLKDPAETGRRLPSADTSAEGVGGGMLYLDRVAELSWELLVAPELERIGREEDARQRVAAADIGMTYEREFKVGDHPAREYSVRLEHERGLVYVCADGARVYVIAGLGAAATDPRLRLFANSFTIGGMPRVPSGVSLDTSDISSGTPGPTATSPLPGSVGGGGTGTGSGTGIGPAYNSGGGDRNLGPGGGGGMVGGGGPESGGPVDYTRPFRQNEVTKRAAITYKPAPGFTEWARRFNVAGVVRLRAILHSSGAVEGVAVVKPLPHGLTRKSIDAARQIRFEPAQKDGRAVSQYVVLEYNFNIY